MIGLLAHATWVPMWLFVMSQIVGWGLIAFWIYEEVKMRFSARSRLRAETIKAQREIHTLAVAAFAEMLDEARFGEIPSAGFAPPSGSASTDLVT